MSRIIVNIYGCKGVYLMPMNYGSRTSMTKSKNKRVATEHKSGRGKGRQGVKQNIQSGK